MAAAFILRLVVVRLRRGAVSTRAKIPAPRKVSQARFDPSELSRFGRGVAAGHRGVRGADELAVNSARDGPAQPCLGSRLENAQRRPTWAAVGYCRSRRDWRSTEALLLALELVVGVRVARLVGMTARAIVTGQLAAGLLAARLLGRRILLGAGPLRSGRGRHGAPRRPRLEVGITGRRVLDAVRVRRRVLGRGNGRLPAVRDYARRRAGRILPAYYVALAGSVALLRDASATPGVRLPDRSLLPAFLVVGQNFFSSPLLELDPPMWTLAVEVTFYALLLLAGWAALRLPRRDGVAAVGARGGAGHRRGMERVAERLAGSRATRCHSRRGSRRRSCSPRARAWAR